MVVSKSVQEEIIAALMKDSYLYSICKEEMTDGYFSDLSCKVIYKALSVYYRKYNSIPGLNELLIMIDEVYYPSVGIQLSEIKDTCCRLFEYAEVDEAFIKDKITDFLRKVRSSSALKNFVDKMKVDPNLESDSVVADLVQALDVQLSTTRVFMMNNLDQVKEARNSAVGSEDQSKIIHSFIGSLNNSLMFGGWQPSTVNMIVSPPGTGKSMFLINEGANAAKQGFDVLHIFVGDMVEYDGFIRYLSCISGMSQNSLVMMNLEKQQDIIKVCNQQYNDIFNHIFILAYPSLSSDINSLIEDINKFEKQLDKDFGMIIIDYPDNLLQEGRSLYEDGGTLYSSLERLARLSKSVVLVASQPQRCYWQHEIIPLEGAAESSKKQMAVDVMLTMNTTYRGSNIGSILLAKVRKGPVGKIFRINTDYSKCHLEEIDEAKYQAIKAASGLK